jgi:hypothetical protein
MNFMLYIPVTNDLGQQIGHLARFLRKTRNDLPRVGEEVFVAPGVCLMVSRVIYDGPSLNSIHIELQTVDQKMVSAFHLSSEKGQYSWRYSDEPN